MTRDMRADQVQMYGEPLGERLGRVRDAYRISQARLAAVLGLSPPMLSQLMSGQRAKISNPAVFARLVRLEELSGHPNPEAALSEVAASQPTLTTATAGSLTAVLAAAFPRPVLAAGASEVSDPALAALLRAAAGSP